MAQFVSSPHPISATRAPGRRIRAALLTGACITALIAGQQGARAGGPSGGNVAIGNASIAYGSSKTTITQSSQKALINWQNFSIASGSSVDFLQPGSSAITLNRVLGPSASTIDGSLFATGQVWLINANGVLFGKGSQINVGGLIATTSDMRDSDFLAGHYDFGIASPNANAAVVNQGTIRTARGGSAILAGSSVTNEGLIQADLGNVVLAGAGTFSVDFNGDNLLRFAIVDPVGKTPTNADGSARPALVSNAGTIAAAGGKVLMTARAASNVVDNVVNNTGMVRATSVSQKDGEIILDAGDGTADAGGTLDASGTASGETGGTVKVLGKTVQVADGAAINASGASGGGTILIGGNFHGAGPEQDADSTTVGKAAITADATQKGDGGRIAVWSNSKTVFNGTLSARGGASGGNGGAVETSGGQLQVSSAARVDTRAVHGRTGSWLLDPENIDIIDGGGDGLGGSNIDPNTIITALASTDVELEATQNIKIDSVVDYSSVNTFTLLAGADINANAGIQNSGTGAINLIAGWNGTTTDLGSLTNPGVYGNNGGSVMIGGESPRGDVSVGSFGGETTVAGANIVVDAENGVAQIGYHGAGSGAIDVLATANVVVNAATASYAEIGNGGPGIGGTVGGDISVTTFGGGITLSASDADGTSIADIGNLGGNGASESGNIAIDTNGGALALASTGLDSFVQIGNWTKGDTTGTSSGTITIDTAGLNLLASGTESYAGIGNGSFRAGNDGGALGGDIDITATTLVVDAEAGDFDQARIGNLGNGVVTGNINIATTGDLTLSADGSVASSGAVASIGNVSNAAAATGNIAVRSGGHLSLLATDIGEARIETGGLTSGTIAVTARDDILLSASGGSSSDLAGSALIGTLTGNADIVVTSLTGKVELDANGDNSAVQIGNSANGQSTAVGGDVTVVASNAANGNIVLSAGGEDALAQIGNSGIGAAPVSGNVTLTAGNMVEFADPAVIGNANPGGALSGSVTINAGVLAGDIRTNLFNDLDYGDFVLNLSGTAALVLPFATDYTSAHGLTISNGGDIEFDAPLQNAGTGDITVHAGGNVLIGGANGAESGVAVGSFGGTTTVTGTDITVEAENGFAQIGFSGAGTGDINVAASGNLLVRSAIANYALIGNGGGQTTGAIGGNIAVTTSGGAISLIATGSEDDEDIELANIGNLGSGNSSESGNITIDTNGGALSLSATGGLGYAKIGNWNQGVSTGTASGDIAIDAGAIDLFAGADMDFSENFAVIGNGSKFFGNLLGGVSGDIQINAASLVMDVEGDTGGSNNGEVRIGNLDAGAVTGNLGIAAAGDIDVTSNGGTVANIGNLSDPADENENPLQANASGNLTVQSGGTITLTGRNGGESRIETGGLVDGTVSVTAVGDILLSASGTSDNFGDAIALIGSFDYGAGGGDVTVTSQTGKVELDAGAFGTVQIGNSGDGQPGQIAGNVTVAATDAVNGNVVLSTAGQNSTLQIGNSNTGDPVSGDVLLAAGNTLETTGSDVLIGNQNPGGGVFGSTTIDARSLDGDIGSNILSDLAYGDFALNLSGPDTLTLAVPVYYASAHNLAVSNGGNIRLEGSLQNSGTGALTLISGGTLTIGQTGDHSTQSQGVTVGSVGGTTTLAANDIVLDASNGFVQIGSAGGSGDIAVNAVRNITLLGGQSTACDGCYAQIGNGGAAAVAGGSGNITVGAGGDITLTGGAQNTSYAQIGNGGDGATGNNAGAIAVTAGGSLVLTGGGDYAAIGNGGRGALGDDSGSITVAAGDITLSSPQDSPFGYAQIGNGGQDATGTMSGNITVSSSGDVTLAAGNATDYVQIGNGAADGGLLGNVSGDITLNAPGAVSVASTGSGAAWLGNVAGSDFTASGNLTLVAASLDGDDLGAMFAQDLGGDAAHGGDVTIAMTGPDGATLGQAVEYSSPHTLSVLSTGDIDILASLQNDGSGAINLVAGWNGTTLDASQFAAPGVFGNDGNIVIGGENALGNVALGSAGGTTTLLASNLSLLADSGYAQLGYHGAASGGLVIDMLDNLVLSGGTADGRYAQIGHGGLGTSGNESGDITIAAGGDVTLTGGSGKEAYAQLGHGGAESNTASKGYSDTGNITLQAVNVRLNAGTGDASYVQIGHGGFESGLDLASGTAVDSGDIAIAAQGAVLLTGNGNDAYAQIGHGGDQANAKAASGTSGKIGGNIVVIAGTEEGAVSLTAGSGSDAYAQIGNGGYGINMASASTPDAFTIGGNITVSDLFLLGGNSGANAFAQIGNGDASATGFGNVGGDITILTDLQSGVIVTDGTAVNSPALIGNATGTGTVTGTVTGYSSNPIVDLTDPELNGVIVSSMVSTSDLNNLAGFGTVDQALLVEVEPATPQLVMLTKDQQAAPIADLAGNGENTEGHTASDSLTTEVVASLGEAKPAVSRVLLGGVLREFPATADRTPRGVPSVDQEFSSWGNEALWQ